MNHLQNLFIKFVTILLLGLLFYVFGPKAYGMLVPCPGIKPISPALEGEVLTSAPPGKSLMPDS